MCMEPERRHTRPVLSSPLSVPFAPRVAGITGSEIDSSTALLERQTHDIVRMAMGSPARDAIPSDVFAELLGRMAAEEPAVFDYGPTEGETALRETLVAFLASQGHTVALDELMITTGGMQGLDLVCKLFVGAGDLVAVESPTYTNGAATITSYEARVLEVPTDDDGMDVEALERMVADAGEAPKVIYVIPTFQNPAGTTLSLARRVRLIELAAEWGALILEDDPYSLLRFKGTALPGLRELADDHADVISVRTFSKFIAPGLRVGWVEAPRAVIARMIDARQGMDTCTAPPMQSLVARFLDGGHAVAHLERMRAEYGRRQQALRTALEDQLGTSGATWTDPDGGFFLWLTLDPSIDTRVLFPIALEEGVAFIPGSAFSVSGRFTNALRLAFSAESPERAREGVRRLARAIAQVSA